MWREGRKEEGRAGEKVEKQEKKEEEKAEADRKWRTVDVDCSELYL